MKKYAINLFVAIVSLIAMIYQASNGNVSWTVVYSTLFLSAIVGLNFDTMGDK